jgi:hypothetical protein
VPTVLKSGIPNLLEPSGPVQGCNGFALPVQSFMHQKSKWCGQFNCLRGQNVWLAQVTFCSLLMKMVDILWTEWFSMSVEHSYFIMFKYGDLSIPKQLLELISGSRMSEGKSDSNLPQLLS